VFASDDAGLSFHPSNEGFSQRQITALVADQARPGDLYAGVLNDKEFGGVFRSHDGQWYQLSEGLGGRDVFDLGQSPQGRLVAATNHGLYVLEAKSQRWEASKNIVNEAPAAPSQPVRTASRGRNVRKAPGPAVKHATFEGRATALALGSRKWYAATEAGVLVSANQGASWSGGAVDGEREFFSVSAHDGTVAASTLHSVWQSSDEAAHWSRLPLPEWVTRIYAVTVTDDDTLWIATREGALRWTRKAQGTPEWEHALNGLPPREVLSIRAEGSRLVAGVAGSKTVYVSRDQGQSWKAEPAAGVEVTGAMLQGETLYVTTRHHGVLVRESSAAAAALRPGGQ
jgi:ligand-binding sensor domain-containing protein